LSIEPCPCDGLGGGQSPDTGFVRLANGSEWTVVDVFSPYERGLAIRIQPASTEQESVTEEDLLCLHKGFQLTAFVDTKRREGVAAHHSATHMLNAALRKTLGKPIMQAGKERKSPFLIDHTFPLPTQINCTHSRWCICHL